MPDTKFAHPREKLSYEKAIAYTERWVGSSRLLSGYGPAQVAPLAPLPTEQAQRRMPREETPLDRAIEAVKIVRGQSSAQRGPEIKPLNFAARSGNNLRPQHLDEMVGQARVRALFARLIASARQSGKPLAHVLLVGSAGTGKTTLAQVAAQELGRRCFMLKAPIAQDVLEALARVGCPGDVVICDEFHMAAKGDRRGANPVAAPEALLLLLEDQRLQTATDVVQFPAMTWVACTTDVGLLPEPLISRFPLQPHLDPYTVAEMATLASQNAESLHMTISRDAALMLAQASGLVPRQMNRYCQNAQALGANHIDRALAKEVVVELNGYTLDGLSPDQQAVLRFLYAHGRRESRGVVTYQASVNSLATATGHSRDTKAIQLFVEPALLRAGLLTVGAQGRQLTDAGIARAATL